MGNFATVKSITDNLITVLKKKGIGFEIGINKEKETPVSKYPAGLVYYEGEAFQENFGEQAKYINVQFLIRVYLKNTDEKAMTRDLQEWMHNIREAVTIGALNIGDLVSTKYVNRVETLDTEITIEESIGLLEYELQVRYREL